MTLNYFAKTCCTNFNGKPKMLRLLLLQMYCIQSVRVINIASPFITLAFGIVNEKLAIILVRLSRTFRHDLRDFIPQLLLTVVAAMPADGCLNIEEGGMMKLFLKRRVCKNLFREMSRMCSVG